MKRLFMRFGSLDEHVKELLRGATTAASLKVVAALATFGLHLMLGRMLGPEGSGVYFLAFTIVTIAAVLARFGLDNALVRFIAAGEAAGQPERVRGVYRLGVRITTIISCALGGLLCAVAPWLAITIFKNSNLEISLQIMAIAVPPFALFVIHAQALQGLKRIRDSIVTLSVIAPIFTIFIGLILIPLAGLEGASGAYVLASILTLTFGIWRWRQSTEHYSVVVPEFSFRELMDSSMPLFWVAIMNLVVTWVSTLMLGFFGSSYDIGLFSAANRTALLVSFVLIAVNSIAAPKFAALYQQGNIEALKMVARSSTKLMIFMATPPLILFVVFPGFILDLFGPKFHEGSPLLQILAAGQFVNVATGSVSLILMMTGHERLVKGNLMLTSSVCLILNFCLVPKYGAHGAAVSTAITTALQNSISYFFVHKKF